VSEGFVLYAKQIQMKWLLIMLEKCLMRC